MPGTAVQKFSVFHDANEDHLKKWHGPYASLFARARNVLDVGCGPMYFADLLRDAGVETVGIDLDPAMVKLGQSRGHTVFQADHRHIASYQSEFGGVHISHVVEHLWGEELVILLEDSFKALRPSGLLIVRTPNWKNQYVREHLFWMDHTHKRPYPPDLLVRMLTDIGFVHVRSGAEPFGVNDVYVIAVKPPGSSAMDLAVKFPSKPLGFFGLVSRRLRRELSALGKRG